MFELAELNHKISKSTYDKELPALRTALLEAQQALAKSGAFQVIILIGGVDGAGRGQTVKILNEWMDARYIETNAMYQAREEDAAHPPMWRFWNALPPKGKIGIFFGSWYTNPIVQRVYKKIKKAEFEKSLDNILHFEKMLTDEGALVLKFWFHLSKKAQKSRIDKLMKNSNKKWRMSETELEHFKLYDKFREISEQALMYTSTAEAPWIIVEGTDPCYRYLTVGKAILSALQEKLKNNQTNEPSTKITILPSVDHKTMINSLTYHQHVSVEEYQDKLLNLQKRFRELIPKIRKDNASVMIVFEGVDAAGKGSSIRRLAQALDPREYRIIPIAAPTEDEKKHPYLWRFWKHTPRTGEVVIFDRSWYGRVLVERVEKFCDEADWKRAYSEIADFEQQLVENKTIIIKFWLSITKEEQLKRFEKRQEITFKNYKITPEDWRNREKWDEYELAVEEMVNRTSTSNAPWIIVEANNKRYAHLKILESACEHIEKKLKEYK